MLLTNETLPLLPVQFSSTDNRHMSCMVNMRVWLVKHFLVTLMIQAVSVNVYIILFFLYVVDFLSSPSFRNFIRAINPNIQLPSYIHKGKYFYRIILLIKEISFVFVYVLFAFLCKWFGLTRNSDRITSMNFRRWLIEGSCTPFLLGAYLCGYYMECLDTIFDEYQLFHLVGMTLKIPLFFWMRYAESQPDLFLNHIQTSLVSISCEFISEDN